MAIREWLGVSPVVPEVDKGTPATVEVSDEFICTLTSEGGTTQAITYVAAAATVADVVAGVVAAWNASLLSLFTGITAVDVATTHITFTSNVDGIPFHLALTEADGGGNDTQTFTWAAVTANSGPNDCDDTNNWTEEDTPDAADDVVLANSGVGILYGLDQSAVTLDSWVQYQSFTGHVGQQGIPLQIGATVAKFGVSKGVRRDTGSQRTYMDLGSDQTAITVFDTASAAASGSPAPLQLLGSHASNTGLVLGGQVLFGDAVDGNMVFTTLTIDGGRIETAGAGTIGTLDVGANGQAVLNSSGTVTTLVIRGSVDLTKSQVARTITNCQMYDGATLKADFDVVTFTNGIDLVECGIEDVTIELGKNVTVTPTSI